MLKIQFADKRQEPFWMMEKSFSIGRAEDNHLTINEDSVCDSHAKLVNKGDTFLLKDLSTNKQTFVNGQRITQKQVMCGDTITIGDVDLEIIDPINKSKENDDYWSLIADSSWLSGQEFPLIPRGEAPILLGRGAQCDIVFPGTHLSRQHAQISFKDNAVFIKDLKSANGSFVNDKKVDEAEIQPGDRIRLDVYSFKVFGPGIELPKSATSQHKALSDTSAPLDATTTKRWKTKPTSPGNREEPTHSTASTVTAWAAAAIVIGVLGYVTYLVLGR